MMYLVEETFKDRETKILHEKGKIYESDNEERILELKQRGFLGDELIFKKDSPVGNETPEEKQKLKEEEPKGKKKGDK